MQLELSYTIMKLLRELLRVHVLYMQTDHLQLRIQNFLCCKQRALGKVSYLRIQSCRASKGPPVVPP